MKELSGDLMTDVTSSLPVQMMTYQQLTHEDAIWRYRTASLSHDDFIKWKHFPQNWPFYVGKSPVTGEVPS